MTTSKKTLEKLIIELPGYDPNQYAGGSVFDWRIAADAIDFIESCCTFTSAAKSGQPFLLERWQKAIVANLFGWRNKDGTRRYRECLLFIGRGNGKSELAAAIICYMIFMDPEPGAQLISAAAKRDQTHFIFDPVRKMIQNCPQMKARAEIYKNSIVVGDRSYRCISREATSEHGGSAHFAVVDELHAQPDRDLVDVLYTSMVKRTNPLMLYVTTSDFDRPNSICNEKHKYACDVRDGLIQDSSFLPAIFEASIDDDWKDANTWKKANPNLGVSIRKQDIEKLAQKAEDIPGFLNTFLRLHLNVRTQSDVRWLSMEQWDANDIEVDEYELDGAECYAGLDLSTTTDISAFVMAFPRSEPKGYDVVCRFWVPEENAHKRGQRDRVPYVQWIREEWITATPGNSIDYDRIREDIRELATRYNIQKIAADRWNATQLIGQLEGDGFNVIAYGQGYKDMSPAAKDLERAVVAGEIATNKNPVLRWMASNVSIETDAAGNIKPSKRKSTERIDGIVALTMAIGLATRENQCEEPKLILC